MTRIVLLKMHVFKTKLGEKVYVNYGVFSTCVLFRESSFNMTGGDEDIEGGGGPKIFRHPKGGLGKFVYLKTNRREGGGT